MKEKQLENINKYLNKFYIFDTGTEKYSGRLVRLVHPEQGLGVESFYYIAIIETVVPDSSDKPAYVSIPIQHEELLPHTVH